MKQLFLICTMAVVVCFAGFCTPQEKTRSANALPANQEQLKALAYFLGSWELTGEVNLAGKPTMPITFERQFKWDLGKNFIQTVLTETKDGNTELRHRSLIGWESKTQRITEWGFWNGNPALEFTSWAETVMWSKEGDNWRVQREGVNGLYTIIDQNTHKWECTFKGDDGSENSWHYTATRRTAAPAAQIKQAALPDNIVKELRFFVGEWTVEGDAPGKSLKGSWSAKWAPEKHCLLLRFPLALNGEEVFGNGVMGWDTATKEILMQMFYSNGVMEHVRCRLESPGVFTGTLVGSAGGEAIEAACEMRTNRPNGWTFKTTGNTVGGRQEGELDVRFVRTEPRPTPKGGK